MESQKTRKSPPYFTTFLHSSRELGVSYYGVKSYTTFIFITVIISLVNNTKNGDSDYLRFCGVAMMCILEAKLSLPGGRPVRQAYRGRTY